jgi:hypothetical protein
MRIIDPRRHPRLVVVTPPGWEPIEQGDVREFAVDQRTRVRIRPVVAMPADYSRWVERVIAEDVDEPELTQVAFEHGTSSTRLPVVFAHYRVRGAGGLVEQRAGVFYRVLHNGAEVVARIAGAGWDDYAETLRPLMMSGHIQWPLIDSETVWHLLGIEP